MDELAKIDEHIHAQQRPTGQTAAVTPDPLAQWEMYVTDNREQRIDDGAIRRKPDFVIEDDRGWEYVRWEW